MNGMNSKETGLRVIAVRETSGEVSELKLSNGRIVSRHEAVDMVARGELTGYITCSSSTGEAYIRATPDSIESNNLSYLPRF